MEINHFNKQFNIKFNPSVDRRTEQMCEQIDYHQSDNRLNGTMK